MVAAEWTFLWWPTSVWAVVVAAIGVVSIGVITALGVLASTAVAIAAFSASAKATKIAVENRVDAQRDGRRRERREFYEVAKEWIAAAELDVIGHGRTEFPHQPKQMADLIDSDTAHDIVWWIDNALRAVVIVGAHGSVDRRNAFDTVALLFGSQGAAWVRWGKFDWQPYTAPPP